MGGRQERRRAAGGHLCHQLQRVIVGEVKIKARGQRLAPQSRLNPPPLPSVLMSLYVCVEDGFWGGVTGEEYLRGADMHR